MADLNTTATELKKRMTDDTSTIGQEELEVVLHIPTDDDETLMKTKINEESEPENDQDTETTRTSDQSEEDNDSSDLEMTMIERENIPQESEIEEACGICFNEYVSSDTNTETRRKNKTRAQKKNKKVLWHKCMKCGMWFHDECLENKGSTKDERIKEYWNCVKCQAQTRKRLRNDTGKEETDDNDRGK